MMFFVVQLMKGEECDECCDCYGVDVEVLQKILVIGFFDIDFSDFGVYYEVQIVEFCQFLEWYDEDCECYVKCYFEIEGVVFEMYQIGLDDVQQQ